MGKVIGIDLGTTNSCVDVSNRKADIPFISFFLFRALLQYIVGLISTVKSSILQLYQDKTGIIYYIVGQKK